MAIDVSCTVEVFEIDGNATVIANRPKIKVKNHWNQLEKVDLIFPGEDEDTRFTVLKRDLEAALQNATNTGRF